MFCEMWANAWFNKKIARVGEMTARSTHQPILQKNKEKGNQKIMFIAKKLKEKHTHTRKNLDVWQIKGKKTS